jgi:hypothetical protein
VSVLCFSVSANTLRRNGVVAYSDIGKNWLIPVEESSESRFTRYVASNPIWLVNGQDFECEHTSKDHYRANSQINQATERACGQPSFPM